MSEPLISVIIPTRDRPGYLLTALQSVRAQTHRPLETIIIDDSEKALLQGDFERLQEPGFRIRWVRNERSLGGSGARNRGLEIAQGEYVAFLDDDDIWMPDKLRLQLSVMRTDPRVSVVSCDYVRTRNGVEFETVRLSGNSSSSEALKMSNIAGSCSFCMVRLDQARAVGGFDPALPSCQDWDFWFRLTQRFGGLGFVPQVLVKLNSDEIERISSSARRHFRGYLRFMRKHREQLPLPIQVFHLLRLAQIGLQRMPWLYSLSSRCGKVVRRGFERVFGYQYQRQVDGDSPQRPSQQ